MKEYVKTFLALCLGVFASLIIAEGLTRIVLPIHPGAIKLDLAGNALNISFLQPGAVYRQFSQEYDALTTITQKGYRVPDAASNPEIIFLGDSFTFGQGLANEETFPYIFSNTFQIPCANLGSPGDSTISELNRLEDFVSREAWRPKYVFLFIFAMTRFLGAGNDLYDNLATQEYLNSESSGNHGKSNLFATLLESRRTLLKYSNVFRIIKFQFGPLLKKYITPSPNQTILDQALTITKEQLFRLDRLSKQYHFEYDIFLIYPVQDIMRGSHDDTFAKLNSIAPQTIKSTAHLFQTSPEQFYFPLDGHLNPKGSQKIADYLIKEYLEGEWRWM